MSKDYYKILEIDEFETAENIKSAYRKLARKWHPDVAGNTPDVLAKFKEINEAYNILSDKFKKDEYDRARRFYNYAKNSSEKKEETSFKQTTNPNKSTNNEQKSAQFNFNWKDILSGIQREKTYKNTAEKTPIKGKDIFADIEISQLDAIIGTIKVVNMLQTELCPKCGGKKFANGTICPHCNGKGFKTSYKKYTVNIPANIKNGSKIRLSGEGEKGQFGGKNGDLYITVKVKENEEYKTEGLNIHKTVPITPYEAVLGANIKINGLNGLLSLNISPNTQNGQKFRLSGCGISQNDHVGDMIITVEIKIPKNLTEEEINLYKKLAEISADNIRDGIYDK